MNLLEKLFVKSVTALSICLLLCLIDLLVVWRQYAKVERAFNQSFIMINEFPVQLKRIEKIKNHETTVGKKY
jgi:hypothetical protein